MYSKPLCDRASTRSLRRSMQLTHHSGRLMQMSCGKAELQNHAAAHVCTNEREKSFVR